MAVPKMILLLDTAIVGFNVMNWDDPPKISRPQSANRPYKYRTTKMGELNKMG
jgi:hypothetical protein